MSLEGKVALVTGGSRGIGEAIALRLAEQGADVAVCASRSLERAQEVATRIETTGRKSLALQADVADEEAVTGLFKQIEDELGPVGILINNAGINRDGLMMRLKLEDWDAVLNVNLRGAYLCTKVAARPMMKARSGRIVNISSVVGLRGNAGQANYAASKAGLIGLTKSTAREFASRGITVNAVCPGYIPTEMTEGIPEDAKEALLAQIPLGRMGSPDEIAAAVGFLASDDAAYITGQAVVVDGGMVM
ncbi:MAG: 3-oxoacyl-[acyl-carrier-protein] reductase [Gemmatimonadetes bacterium]|nr:3-oxoacyl-[acyl-carrier-protein] reductase [Gemmatimonadota bacterium]